MPRIAKSQTMSSLETSHMLQIAMWIVEGLHLDYLTATGQPQIFIDR